MNACGGKQSCSESRSKFIAYPRESLQQTDGGLQPDRSGRDKENIETGDQQEENRSEEREESTFDNKYCNYCGNDILSEENIRQNKKVYHQHCLSVHEPRFARAAKAFRGISKNKHVLRIAIHVKYLFGIKEEEKGKRRNKKEKRDIKIREFLKHVSALRNSNSGYLLIHLVGLNPDDPFLGAFDKFVDVKLQSLINDGSLFADVYKKRRLSDYEKKSELKDFKDILVLYVEGAKFLTTSDFKTKVALDDCIVDIPDLTLATFLQTAKPFKETHHKINPKTSEDSSPEQLFLEDLCSLNESRVIQTKAYFQPDPLDDKIIQSLFGNLRLAEYITAFSKNEEGGSYFWGLLESDRPFESYQSKVLTAKPVKINNRQALQTQILTRVSETCLVCDYEGRKGTSENLVKIYFIPTATPDSYVIHVSVRSVSGIVFYDKDGPEAYMVQQAGVTRMPFSNWFRVFSLQLDQRKSFARRRYSH